MGAGSGVAAYVRMDTVELGEREEHYLPTGYFTENSLGN